MVDLTALDRWIFQPEPKKKRRIFQFGDLKIDQLVPIIHEEQLVAQPRGSQTERLDLMPNLNVYHFRSVGVGFTSDSELQKAKSFSLGTTSSATRALSSMNGRCLTNCPSLRCSNRKIHMPDTNLTPRFNNMVREIESEKKIT
nr:hypothetical protein Iba_chr10fCG11260 [Ipomoea batatas]